MNIHGIIWNYCKRNVLPNLHSIWIHSKLCDPFMKFSCKKCRLRERALYSHVCFELQCKLQASDKQIHWRSSSEIPFVLNIWKKRRKISPTERKTVAIFIFVVYSSFGEICAFSFFDSIGFFCSKTNIAQCKSLKDNAIEINKLN